MQQNFFTAVYQAVQAIPKGKVATYGDIAKAVVDEATPSPNCSKRIIL